MKSQWGIATLELAVTSIVVLTLALGGFGVVSYISELRFVNAVVDRTLHDNNLRPFRLGTNASLEADITSLNSHLTKLVASASTDLQRQYQKSSNYFAQALYCLIQIDPRTGAAFSVNTATCVSRQQGALRVPANILAETDLLADFQRYARQQSPIPVGGVGVRSQLAVTSATYGRAGLPQYLERAVLVGIRAVVSLNGSLPGAALNHLGTLPLVYNRKTTQLRGVMN